MTELRIRVKPVVKELLETIKEKNGFSIDSSFVVGRDGHLINDDEDLYTKGQQVGIVATLRP